MTRLIFVLACIAALFAGAATAQEVMADNNIGKFKVYLIGGKFALADTDGRTLYTSAKDAHEKSNCDAACLAAWTPVFADGADKSFENFQVFKRDDGKMQWAFEGRPLYRSAKDAMPGTAAGVDDTWAIVEVPAHEM